MGAQLSEAVIARRRDVLARLPMKAKIGAGILILFILVAIIGPWIAPFDPSATNSAQAIPIAPNVTAFAAEAPGLALYITENGCVAADYLNPAGEVNDFERVEYLHSHFDAAWRAIQDGVNLGGYFVWSLMDNSSGPGAISSASGWWTSTSPVNAVSPSAARPSSRRSRVRTPCRPGRP